MGITFIRVCLVDGPASARSFGSPCNFVVGIGALEGEVETKLVPHLRPRLIKRKKPKPLRGYRALFALGRGTAATIAAYDRIADSVASVSHRMKG